jgi:transcriptional regulator with XRE-family HTH domain
MRAYEELAEVAALRAKGLNDTDIARLTGVPRSTVARWRRSSRGAAREEVCPQCLSRRHDFASLPPQDYAYLLGLYLGDGDIARHPRDVFRLTVSLDQRYPDIVEACASAVTRVIDRPPGIREVDGCVRVVSYSKRWPCFFPQHGPGRKHERAIRLSEWQERIVRAEPQALVRGLIHSDGWRGVNRVESRGKSYVYPRYNFTNVSADIRRIFCEACDLLGVEWRTMGAKDISVARKGSVRLLDIAVGPKS